MTASSPLFYSNITPLDAARHVKAGLRANLDVSFAARTHAVPVNAIECIHVAATYPIVFSPDAQATPAAVLGLRDGENLFVTRDSKWAIPEAYIPSYIRRYPFLLASVSGTDQLTLCVDDVPTVTDPQGGQLFFKPDATPTDMTSNALEFCKSFHAATLQTQAFSAALLAAGVLVDRAVEIPVPGIPPIKFGGFRTIDDQKFAALPDATILEWRRQGFLAPVYAVMMSMGRWSTLARLYTERRGQKAA